MLDLANLATSTLLGLLVAILAAVLAVRTARTGTPALAGTPLVAMAAPRGNTGRGNTGRATRRTTTRNSAGRGNRRNTPTERGNGRKGSNGTQTAPAQRDRATTPANGPTVNPKSGLTRLAPGGLRDQVLAYLQAHPSEDFSPTQVANALDGRSSGAVGNALERLTEQGHVTKTSAAPRRFTIPT